MRTQLLPYGGGVVEYGVAGSENGPATLFLHGLAGSIEDTRPLASGVPGRKVFAHLPGHGRSTGPEPLTYDVLADAARAVADHEHVRAALGVSLGAATLLKLLTEDADVTGDVAADADVAATTTHHLDRVVLFLPAVADIPRRPEAVAPHLLLADRLAAADAAGTASALLQTQPEAIRATPIARDWAARRAAELLADLEADGGDPRRLLPLASAVPLRGPAGLDKLRGVRVPVLVIAQEGDPAHPVEVARRIAGALPHSDLAVYSSRGALWGHRRELRDLVAPFLVGHSTLSDNGVLSVTSAH